MFKQKEANLPSGMKQSTVALKVLADPWPVAPLKSHKLSLEYATFWQPAETSCMLK